MTAFPEPDAHDARPGALGLALTAAGMAAIVWQCIAAWGTRLQDDAYISFVYSRNFARGDGLVYNLIDAPVEGYSNFLWTLGAGLAMKFGVEDPAQLAQGVGTAAAALVVVLTFLLGRRLGASSLLAGIAALFFALERTLVDEAVGGLETTTFVALVLGAVLLYLREPRTRLATFGGPTCLALASLTRPEAPFYFAALELRELFEARRRGEGLVAWVQSSLPRWAPFLLIVGGHLAWRLSFYGELLPNTYYAKMTHSPLAWETGIDYVLQGLAYSGFFLLLLPLWSGRGMRRGGLFLAVLCLVFSAYVLQVGGDFKLSFRYLLAPMALWAALAAAAMGALDRAIRDADEELLPRWLAPALLVLLSGYHVANERLYKPSAEKMMAQRHEHLVGAGKLLDQMLPIDATIAVSNAGRLPYFSQRDAIDMLGLNDHHIARQPVKPLAEEAMVGHERGDGKYVLDREPDAILFVTACITASPIKGVPQWRRQLGKMAFGTSEKEIVPDYRFINGYELMSAAIPGLSTELDDGSQSPVYLNWFQRKKKEGSR